MEAVGIKSKVFMTVLRHALTGMKVRHHLLFNQDDVLTADVGVLAEGAQCT